MTLSNLNTAVIGSDRPTIVMPPANDGPFQGWGTRIG
jgi:hypothetical protein